MQSFIRFVFFVLAVGTGLNLAIVLLANTRSQRQQKSDAQEARKQFDTLAGDASNHFRRLDIVVESQLKDARGNAVQTTLLARQYASMGRDLPLDQWTAEGHYKKALPVVRVVIPGDRVTVEGVVLEFTPLFAKDAEEYRIPYTGGLGTKILYFGTICGESQTRLPQGSDERFTFMPPLMVPELTRINPLDDQPTYYEMQFWQYVWNLIGDPPHDLENGRPASISQGGLNVTWTKPATQQVSAGNVYSVFVYSDGGGTLSIDEAVQPAVFEDMITEGKSLKEMPLGVSLGG